jgi:hypothetical protein
MVSERTIIVHFVFDILISQKSVGPELAEEKTTNLSINISFRCEPLNYPAEKEKVLVLPFRTGVQQYGVIVCDTSQCDFGV